MRFLDAKDAVAEMRKHGFDIVRCEDCKRSGYDEKGDRYYCYSWETFMDRDFFCKKGIHTEKYKCYECPIAESHNLEDDDTPCRDCEATE